MAIDTQAQASTAPVPSDRLWVIGLLAAAVLATALAAFATASAGPGIGPDGVVYIDVARHLAAGDGPVAFTAQGETELVVTWPPLFATLVSVGVLFGADAVESARWLNAVAFGALCYLLGLLAWRVSGRREGGLVAAWLAALSPALLLISGSVLTEPIFLALIAGMLLLLIRGGRWSLIGAGLLAGLACMQRYAGYAFVAAGAVWLLQQRGLGWRGRLTHAGWFVAAAAPLPIGWRLAALLGGGTLDSRSAGFTQPTATHFKAVAHSISTWLLPEAWPVAVRAMFAAAVLIAMLAGVYYAIRQRLRAKDATLLSSAAMLLVVCGAAYSALLAVTILLLDPLLQPDPRLLLPLLPLAVVGLAAAVGVQTGRTRKALVALTVVLLVCLAMRAGSVSAWLRDGYGYSGERWRQSATLHAALELPPEKPVWSNNPQPLILYGERPVRALPLASGMEYTQPGGTPPYADLDAALYDMRVQGLQGGCIVWFDHAGSDEELGRLIRELDLVPAGRYEDGLLLSERTPRK